MEPSVDLNQIGELRVRVVVSLGTPVAWHLADRFGQSMRPLHPSYVVHFGGALRPGRHVIENLTEEFAKCRTRPLRSNS